MVFRRDSKLRLKTFTGPSCVHTVDNHWTHLVGIGDGPDLEVNVELGTKDLPLLHQHRHQAGAYYSGADQAHAYGLRAGRSVKNSFVVQPRTYVVSTVVPRRGRRCS